MRRRLRYDDLIDRNPAVHKGANNSYFLNVVVAVGVINRGPMVSRFTVVEFMLVSSCIVDLMEQVQTLLKSGYGLTLNEGKADYLRRHRFIVVNDIRLNGTNELGAVTIQIFDRTIRIDDK